MLFFAISIQVTKAYTRFSEIEKVNISETNKITVIEISFSKPTKVVPYLKNKDNCIILEFDKAAISSKIKNRAFANRDVKLGYLYELNNTDLDNDTDKKKSDKKVMAKFYLKQECLPSFKQSKNKVTLKLCIKENDDKSNNKKHKPHNTLLKPGEEKYSPVFISLEDASFKTVVTQLASQAGVDLLFKGKLPDNFSIELQSEDPLTALYSIAEKTNAKFYREGKIWYMEGEI